MPKDSLSENKIDRLEDKLKLAGLQAEKKFADLELAVAKLEDKFKDIWELMPQVSERSEEIEDMINVLNLGIREFKEGLDDANSRLQAVEGGAAEDVQKAFGSYETRLVELNNDIKKLGTDIDIMKTEKDDLTDMVQKDVLPALDDVRTSAEENKARLDEIRKLSEDLKVTVKSFEKSMDMVDIKSLIGQFTNVNSRMTEMQGKLNEVMQVQPPELETFVEETRKMKSYLKDINTRFVDNLNRVGDLDAKMSVLDEKIDRTLSEVNRKLEGFDMGRLENGIEAVNQALARFEQGKAEIDRLTTKNERINLELSGKAELLAGVGSEIENLKKSVESVREAEEELIKNYTNSLNEVRASVDANAHSIDERLLQTEGVVRDIAERVELMRATKAPEDVGGQLRLLRSEMNALISEDKRLRKEVIELQKSRLKTIPPEILTQALTRVNALERKLSDIARSISHDLIMQPVIIE